MFDKIKKYLGIAVGAVIGFLLMLLGIERKRRKNAQEHVEELKTINELHEAQEQAVETAVAVSEEVNTKINVIAKEESQLVKEAESKPVETYNNMINNWNDEK